MATDIPFDSNTLFIYLRFLQRQIQKVTLIMFWISTELNHLPLLFPCRVTRTYTHTRLRDVPKVMFPIYFYGSDNRYREYNGLQNTIFLHIHFSSDLKSWWGLSHTQSRRHYTPQNFALFRVKIKTKTVQHLDTSL